MKPFHVRWMLRGDMPDIIEIEQASFEVPWTEKDFMQTMRDRNVIGRVAEDEQKQVVGFIIYALEPEGRRILDLAVSPVARRNGIGSALLRRLDATPSAKRRQTEITVSEGNLAAQLFFRANGYRAVRILHNCFNPPQDGYLFRLEWKPGDEFALVNRIGHLV